MSTQISKRRLLGKGALAAGVGVGALALLAPQRASADTPFTGFPFPATGTPTPRTMPDRLAEIKNVKDFGAVGNGSTDDTAAIQAAVNKTSAPFSTANRGTIYFPSGTYRLTAPVTYELSAGIRNISFVGAPGAKLIGNFPDALLKRSPNSPTGSICTIEQLMLENAHATGKGIMFHSLVGGKIVNCHVSAWRGIETFNSQSICVDSCAIIRSGSNSLSGSIGIIAGNATSVFGTDVSGYENGIRHCNVGLFVIGGRFEVNTVGIRLGVDENNAVFQSTSVSITGPSMEANQTAIEARALAGGNFSFSCGGGVSMAYGLHIISCQDVVVAGVVCSGSQGFTQAAIAVDWAIQLVMLGVSAPSWRVGSGVNTSGFIQTNRP